MTFLKKNSGPKIPVAIAISLLRGEEAKGKCSRVCIFQGKGKCWLAVMFPECSTFFSADLAKNMWLLLPWLKQSALIIIVSYYTNAGGDAKLFPLSKIQSHTYLSLCQEAKMVIYMKVLLPGQTFQCSRFYKGWCNSTNKCWYLSLSEGHNQHGRGTSGNSV